MLSMTGRPVQVWARDKAQRKNYTSKVPGTLVTDNLEEACAGARFIVFAVPADAVVEVAGLYGDVARGDHVVVHGVRGFGPEGELAHQAIRNQTRVRLVAALGGPLYFDDMASGRPIVAVVASRFREAHQAVADVTAKTPARVHRSDDIVGVEVAGAISNVTHLAVGMSQAFELGETARGILLTHGFADAERLGIALGGSPATFSGLAGVGDLIPRPVRSTERHQRLGAVLAKGGDLVKAQKALGGCVEGITSARAASRLAGRLKLKLPLVEAVASILDDGADPLATLEDVLSRDILIGAENNRPRMHAAR